MTPASCCPPRRLPESSKRNIKGEGLMLDCSHLVGDTESVRQVRNGKSASRQPSSEWRMIRQE